MVRNVSYMERIIKQNIYGIMVIGGKAWQEGLLSRSDFARGDAPA